MKRPTMRVDVTENESGVWQMKFFYGDFQIYEAFELGHSAMCEKLYVVSRALKFFPVEIWGRAKIESEVIGRKVYWREFPAIVQDFDGERGRVVLRPQLPMRMFPAEPWDLELGGDRYMSNGNVKEDLLSPKIYWFRETQNAADQDTQSSAIDTDRKASAPEAVARVG